MREKSSENLSSPIASISKCSDALQTFLEAELDIFCVLDADGRFLRINEASYSILGYPGEHLLNQRFIDFSVPDDTTDTLAFIKSLANGEAVTQFKNRFVHRNGELVSIVWSGRCDAEQNIIYCAGKEVCAPASKINFVRNPEFLLKQTLRIAKMGSWDYDANTNRLFWSRELFDLYGVVDDQRDQDLEGLFFRLVHPDDLPAVREYLNDVNNLKTSFVHRLLRPDGTLIYVSQNISVLKNNEGRVVKLAGLTQDVTESNQYKAQLEQKEQRFRSLVQIGSDIIGIIDPIGNYHYVSDNTHSLLGYEPTSFIGKNAFDYIHPEDAQSVYEQLSVIGYKNFVDIKPFRFRHADGEWRWIETKVSNRINDPAINGLVVNSRDITDKKEVGDQLSQLSKIAEETTNAVVITDTTSRISWVNNAFEKITGYSFHDVRGKKPGDFLQGPLSDPDTIAHMHRQVSQGEPFDVEIINYTKEAAPYWMHIQCQPQVDEAGRLTGFFAIQTDITERKRLEEQLQEEVRQRQKRVTSAIVKAQEKERTELSNELHDNVNQILTTVKLYLEMAMDGTPNNEFVTKAREMVQASIDEIRQISKRLATPDLADLNLKNAIQELVDSIAITGKLNMNFTEQGLEGQTISDDIRLALYRIVQEHLTNIIKHACASNVQIYVSVLGEKLRLKVTDDGKGFDTKQKRKGIGLNNMRNRVETVNGKLEIKSKPGDGCKLLVVLPLTNCPKNVG